MHVRLLPFQSVLALLLVAGCAAEAPTAATPAADPVAVAPAPTEAAPSTVAPGVAPEPAVATGVATEPTPVAPPSNTPASPEPAAPKITPTSKASTPTEPAPTPATATAAAPVAPEAAAAPVATVADYTLDPGKSALYVQVFKDSGTLASGLSHDHVVTATGWSGTVRWDPASPAACKVDITVPVSGLRPDDEAMRKRVGYDVMLEPSQREEVKGNMLAAGQLDAKRFGSITFVSTRCEAAGDKVKVTGTLTIHGVPKAVSSTMKLSGDGNTLTASGTFNAKATDFGFDPYTALLGALKNKNEMKFTVDVRGAAK
ncbi:MAG: YceI family protein [Myxococcota bacterium]